MTRAQVDEFLRDGFLLLPSFYDPKTEIEPIQHAIYQIIGVLIRKYGQTIEQPPFHPDTFDSGYQPLLAHDRKIGGEVYDAIKQIPAFIRLVASPKHDALMSQLRNTDMPGVAAGGYGIRIDNPNEEKYRANWHQDYPSQFRSLDGLVFWSPLIKLTQEMGPLQLAVGSHKDGLAPVLTKDPQHPEKTGAYALRLHNEAERIARYRQVSPLMAPSDLAILDFLNVHASGFNQSGRSRWSMQIRYFNYREPTGVRIGWRGSFAAGTSIKELHPELIAD